MNDLRWGQTASTTRHTSDDAGGDESWEWFVESLELDRIQLTLSQFPVADTLEPVFESTIECTIANTKKNEQMKMPSSTDSKDSTDDDSGDDDNDDSVSTSSVKKKSDSGDDRWRGSGDDIRYSPGFILPLILAVLDSYLPNECLVEIMEDKRPNEEMKPNNDVPRRRAFGNMCRRLGDRGGIALAVASLSSRCPKIRQVAVAICGLFLRALQMPESHELKSWRERPQQEMVMSSIQRGLAVRRSLQIRKYENQGGIELGATPNRYNIPMLPAVSAVFLAKASLVLAKPRDDMYGQINRYFLRSTDFHGAFQDCFGLPAFLSLYCSSSDDISRCKAERNWALLTLKDGAVDEYCYRIISQHHVPELIMTSFDSLIDSTESKSELYLTIDVIETLLQAGGTRASTYLIQRQGLLSWLHGILSWRKISPIFPYDALKCKFLKLIASAVGSYRRIANASDDDDNDEVESLAFYEKIPLANAVIQICLDEDGSDSSPESSISLLKSTCNALFEIYLADKESQVTNSFQGITTVSDMTTLLKKFIRHPSLPDMFEKVLISTCDLPLISDQGCDHSSAEIFCELSLEFVVEKGTDLQSDDAIILTMKRVHEIMKLHPQLQEDASLLSQITKCRRLAVIVGGLKVWNLFIPILKGTVNT